MESTDRMLLRLHAEAVWDVRLHSSLLNDVELLQEGSQPSCYITDLHLTSEKPGCWKKPL